MRVFLELEEDDMADIQNAEEKRKRKKEAWKHRMDALGHRHPEKEKVRGSERRGPWGGFAVQCVKLWTLAQPIDGRSFAVPHIQRALF